jgi:proteasome lid subunit RPN8/RPN11
MAKNGDIMGNVDIQPSAFKNMIFHVLRFVNEIKDEPTEVLGLCIGNFNSENDTVTITDSIPLLHGDKVELGLSQELHDIFEEVKASHESIIGYYVSHPGYGLFLTDSDKKIQQYFQTKENPNAICIVFDHTLLKDKFGVKVFKFKDYENAEEIVEILPNILIPDNLEYFKWVQALVENFQRKEPMIIKEYLEIQKPLLEQLQEIPQMTDMIEESKEKLSSQMERSITGIKTGATTLVDTFVDNYVNHLDVWLADIEEGSLKGMNFIQSSLNQLKNTIGKGLDGLEKYFQRKFNEITALFVDGITESLESRIQNQKDLEKHLTSQIENIISNSKEVINQKMRDLITVLESQATQLGELATNHDINAHRIEELIDNNTNKISSLYSMLDVLSEDVRKRLETSSPQFEKALLNEIENQGINFVPINEKYGEIELLIEKLQNLISELRQMK